MTRRCECGHSLRIHAGLFGDCLAAVGPRLCDCRDYLEAPRFWYLRRVWRWLREVPR